jgi:hypothetical protein
VELRGYKTAPLIAVRLHGKLFWLATLPRLHLQRAEAAAAYLFKAWGCEPSGSHFEMARRAHVLAAALGCEAEEALYALSAADVTTLYFCWAAHQVSVGELEHPEAVREELRKRVNDDVQVILDGEGAYLAGPASPNPQAFYGRPVVELTGAQLDYYTLVRAAFIEFHVEGKHKEVSRAWLQSASE